VIIQLKKNKIRIWVIISLTLIGLGVYGLLSQSVFMKIIGGLLVISFIINLIDLVTKLFNSNKALIIDDYGIIDNSLSGISTQIPWSDIIEVKIDKVLNKTIVIVVSNPEYYINNSETSELMRSALRSYLIEFGSPFIIPNNKFQYDFDKLKNLIESKLNESKEI